MKILRIIMKIVFVLIIINVIVISGYFIFLKKEKDDSKKNENLIVDKIDSFSYVLDNNKDEKYKSLFNELKNTLLKNEVNDEEYAKALSKIFITDLFTLSNKISSSDIGGIEFVYKDFQKNFLSIAKTTLYNSVKSNIYSERVQELPTVVDVSIKEIKQVQFKYKDTIYDDAYSIKVLIEYEKDLGYPSSCDLILIRNETRLEVAKLG